MTHTRMRTLGATLVAAMATSTVLGTGLTLDTARAADAAPAERQTTQAAQTTEATGTTRTADARRDDGPTRAERILGVARAQADDVYRYGAAGPDAFDCSGFTQFVFRNAVGEALPHSSAAQVDRTQRVTPAEARPGDLVFFYDGGGVYHVGIYAGDGYMWNAANSEADVERTKIWTDQRFFGRVR
ncbi:C40 family peptidase [Nocardioides sp. Leaf374]|uniref:C40 family peptidase n=1 Tax=Nocardioides sp. Leaf374 TaxID=2876560 RepID=UPI001E3E8888|nr:NlpC/P60 family protein [Nocardioides sp. Leaf374]